MLDRPAERYGLLARSLHWSIALLISGLIGLGWYMVGLTYYDPWYNDSLTVHRALGLLVLVLGVAMAAWRIYSRPPRRAAPLKPWERTAANIVHSALYGIMLAIPLTGYLISTSAGSAIPVFNGFEIPALYPVGEALRDWAVTAHYYLAYGSAGLIAVHALAALKHQFIDQDGTLGRML